MKRTDIRVVTEVMEQQAQQEESHGTILMSDTVLASGSVADAHYAPFSPESWTDPDVFHRRGR